MHNCDNERARDKMVLWWRFSVSHKNQAEPGADKKKVHNVEYVHYVQALGNKPGH